MEMPAAAVHDAVPGQAHLCLIGGPYVLSCGRRFVVPDGSKRLLAYVALNGGRVDRRRAAGALWPWGADDRAAGNLRSALWRLKCAGIEIIETHKTLLALTPDTDTDVHLLCDWAGRVIEGTPNSADLRALHWDPEAADILPGWYEDWVVFERERIRQRLLHGLEAVGRLLLADNRAADAVEAALDAVRIEPLRESAQRLLIEAHLAERNYGEALRTYRAYEKLLQQELAVRPGRELSALVAERMLVTDR